MPDAIVTHRLSKAYGGRRVVDDLSLRVSEGAVYALLGRNGAGKSTTLKMLAGMVQPDRGRIELLGEEIATLRPATRGRIAYLAEGHPLYGWMTIREAVAFTRSFYPDADPDLLEQVLDHFGLPPRAKIGRLSKGQRAQVSLALGVAPDPELLILDDPTLGLDTTVRFPLMPQAASEAPFLGGSFLSFFGLVGFVFAMALGFRQSAWEGAKGTYLFLLHRPVRRETIFLTKVGAGLVVVLASATLPVVLYGWWASVPGHHPSPFAWSMTLDAWKIALLFPAVYLGAFLSGLWPGRWLGTRLLR